MSYATYMLADAFPGKTGEREIHPHSNVNSYDYGQTMRYAEQEVSTKREEMISSQASEENTYTFSLPRPKFNPEISGFPQSIDEVDEWQPWMQRRGTYVAQSRISDIEETLADKTNRENSRYGVPDEYVAPANETRMYMADRINQEISFEPYTN